MRLSFLILWLLLCTRTVFCISAQGWIGIPKHQNTNNAGSGSGAQLSGNFLAGLHSFFIGQSCRLEQRFAREFRRAQKPETSCILLQY